MSEKIIQMQQVSKWFGDFQVLKDINLDVTQKQKIVVCGPSGSGKSTLIRCINRLEEHQQGKIVVDGIELTGNLKNIDSVRREVGMVLIFLPRGSFVQCASVLSKITLCSEKSSLIYQKLKPYSPLIIPISWYYRNYSIPAIIS